MDEELVKKIKEIIGEKNVADAPAELYVYGSDASIHQKMADLVVRPETIEQVKGIMKFANERKIPVIARGAGSGMSGHTVPIDGGIVMDMKQMNHILEIKAEDMYCRVEAGVVDDDLNRELKPYGVTYPPSPASSNIATIGGEIANNASGIRSVKYGATRDYVLGMKVVLGNGKILDIGAKTRVEASGYQLHRLMVGSEGTLGIIVEATLKFIPLPKFRCLGRATFESLEDAGNTITDIISGGSEPSMLELMDNVAIKAVNTALDMGLPDVEAIILFEADGKVREAVDYEMQVMKEICEKNKGNVQEMSYDASRRKELYAARKKLFPSLSRYREGYSCTSLADDMAVPYSRMADTAVKIHEIADRNGVIMTAYGHCGSGVMHTKILMDTGKKEQWEGARSAVEEIYDYVDSIGGITSGEHGIAISKAPSWKKRRKELLPVMRDMKKTLDPNNILNPHKLMDAPDDWYSATPIRYKLKN